jgi:predicted metalloprotease with PDZ domain
MRLKFYFLIFLIFFTSELSSKKLTSFSYLLEIKKSNSTYVDISLNVSDYCKYEDEVVFKYDTKSVYYIKVYTLKGKRLNATTKEGKLKFKLKDKNSFFIKYRVRNTKNKYSKDTFPLNIKTKDSLILFGKNTFLKPIFHETINVEPKIYVKYETPIDWKTISSWEKKKDISLVSSLNSLLDGIIITGDLNIKKLEVKGKNYVFSFIGEWEESDRVISIYKTIARKQIDLFKFLPVDFLLVAFIKDKSGKEKKGFQYTNSIVYFLDDKIDLQDIELLKLFSHEHFHLWNGKYIKPKAKDKEKLTWFYEGVTDYYGLLILYSSGLISEKSFLDYLAALYVDYENNYFKPHFFEFLAMDLEIIKASKYKKSLDDVFKNMFSKNMYWKKGYSHNDLKLELAKLSNWDLNEFLNDFIIANKKLELKPYLKSLGLKLETVEEKEYDQEFKINTYKGIRQVINLSKESDAYKKGLRGYDRVREFIKPRKKGQLATIKISRRWKRRTYNKEIKFNPWKNVSKIVFKKNENKKLYDFLLKK